MDQEQREERNKETYGMLKPCLERAMALQTALLAWDGILRPWRRWPCLSGIMKP